jgi:hypothetical protein
MKSVLDNLTRYNPTISIQEIEHNDKDKLAYGLKQQLNTDNINAYPELKMINTQNRCSTYSGPRTVVSISEWIHTNSNPLQKIKASKSTTKSRHTSKTKSKSRSRTRSKIRMSHFKRY